MGHDHHHKFDPADAARLDDPRRRDVLPPAPLVAALPLHPGDRVADLGTGTGYWLRALLDAAPAGTRFWAVDTETAMLDHLADRLRDHPRRADVMTVRSTEHAVPLPDASVDVAVMGMVYHELADRRGYLAEVRRLLVPGGRLAIIDWAVLPPDAERTMGPPNDERVPFETAKAELAAAGFDDVVRVEGYQETWCVVAATTKDPIGDCDAIEFLVEQLPGGSYVARSIGACVTTEADTLDELRAAVREAVCCHFDEGCKPAAVRLRFFTVVREEMVPL